jgi:hypothetical protein
MDIKRGIDFAVMTAVADLSVASLMLTTEALVAEEPKEYRKV